MNIENIPFVTVSYNAPDLIDNLISSTRHFYNNKIYVIDGSDSDKSQIIKSITEKYSNTEFFGFDYNIHHGPGIAWAIKNLNLSGPVLFIDSDMRILERGFIEKLLEVLKPSHYGVGNVIYINEDGFTVDKNAKDAAAYLHPALMLCNIEEMKKWPMPIKHGAPMTETMLEIHRSQLSNELFHHLDWVCNIIENSNETPIMVKHEGRGTVLRSGSYNLDEWFKSMTAKRENIKKQNEIQNENRNTPYINNNYNYDLLSLIPTTATKIAEVGCNTGNLASAVKIKYPNVNYIGFEIDHQAAATASKHCDIVEVLDIEIQNDDFWKKHSDRDCWIFGDVLEHLKDPWSVLKKIKANMPKSGSLVICVPNIQHWSVQGRLSIGEFRYDPNGGLLDRTHLRWFTRITIFEMLNEAGFTFVSGVPRIFNEPQREPVLDAIRHLAKAMGKDPETAVKDAIPLQYVIHAITS